MGKAVLVNYIPEHHPDCPRFESFEAGDDESTAPACQCKECSECKGGGSVIFSSFQAGDQYYMEEMEDCHTCDGHGRVML